MLNTYSLFGHPTIRLSKARHTRFAGGEQHFVFHGMPEYDELAFMQGASSDDVIALRIWAEGIREQRRHGQLTAFIPYLPAARADRGNPLSARIYADIINEAGLDQVICLDPHSDVAPSHYRNLKRFEAVDVIRDHLDWLPKDISAVLAPDAGAAKRAQSVADMLGVPMFQATKKRDFETKQLSDFRVPASLPEVGTILVVDDICDAGGTFCGLAETMLLDRDRLALWVTHGIFSHQAPQRLTKHYWWIGTTDSHPGSQHINEVPGGRVIPLIPWLESLYNNDTL